MSQPHAIHRAAAVLAIAALGLSACGRSSQPEQTLRIAAAASLSDALTEIVEDYEAEHPNVTVETEFAGSSDLAAQINGGADFDIFASADEATMDKVSDSIAGEPKIFATNTLTIITEPGNPEKVRSLKDLEQVSVTLVTCAEPVPCGRATQQLARKQGVSLVPVSEENKVTDILAKVTSGEADAGIVYVTDATAAGDEVDIVPIKGADEVVNRYPIAALTSASSDAAQDFITLVTGSQGQLVLSDHGFGAP